MWALNGLRCCGARLIRVDGQMRLLRGEEMTAEEYGEAKQRYLMPHAGLLNRLLKDVGVVERRLARERRHRAAA